MPASFVHRDLTGASFVRVDLTESSFRSVDLSRSRFTATYLSGVVMRGVELQDVEISGDLERVTVNGVDIAPLVEAELDRRDPERPRMRPTDAAGFRAAWEILERRWAETVDHAGRLDPDQLHQSVDGEWSFVQTLRHLVYATDVWVRRVMLGDPRPWDALSLPFDEMTPDPEVPWDRDARPSLEEVLVLRADRQATVRQVLDELTDEQLVGTTTPVTGPGWPPPQAYPVAEALRIVLNEEWQHRLFAERDLALLGPANRPTANTSTPNESTASG